jgi:hypothetical protein
MSFECRATNDECGVKSNHGSADLRIRILSCVLLFSFIGCSRAPKDPFPLPERLPMVQARISDENPNVGDVLDLRLRVSAESPLTLPDWREALDPQVRVLEQLPDQTVAEDNRWQRASHLRVALYRVTNVTLFAQAKLSTLDEAPVEVPLPFVSLAVEALTTDEETVPNFGSMELMDFRGSEAKRRFRRNVLWTLAGLLGVALLIYALWKRAESQPPPPPPPPKWDRIALRRMQELRQKQVWISGDADASAVELSFILREYIEGRFEIHAPDLTTEEFLQEASQRQPWSDEEQKELEGFFTAVDRIKFAAERPGMPALEALMEAAERFVRVTGEGGGA